MTISLKYAADMDSNGVIVAPTVSDGDLMIVEVTTDSGTPAITLPAGWIEEQALSHTVATLTVNTFSKVASGESGSYDFSSSAAVYGGIAVYTTDTGGALSVAAKGINEADTSTSTSPSLAALSGDMLHALFASDEGTAVTTAPTGMTSIPEIIGAVSQNNEAYYELLSADDAALTRSLVWNGTGQMITGALVIRDSNAAAATTIDDITFDIPEWIGLPANDYTLEAEDDNGTVSLAAITFQLPAGWVSQVADGTGGSDADSLAKQFLDAYGITVVAGDVYATNGNTVGADGVPPNATGFTARLYDASASQWTTEYTYVPALVIDSATAGPLQAGDTLTITHSNASASGKTYTIGGLAVTEVSQDATTSVLTIPDPKTYGAKSLSYNTDLPIVVTDGADTASILRQIAPDTGHFYGTVADQAAWIAGGYTEVVDGDNVYAIRTSGTTTPVIASFSFLGPSTWDIYIQQASDNVWGLVGTLTVPTLGAPNFLPIFARFNNQLMGGM